MYNWAKVAFESNQPEGKKRSDFRNIYNNLKNYWKVFRNVKGPIWSADQAYEAMTRNCKLSSRQSGLTLMNLQIGTQEAGQVLACLDQLRDLKPQSYYPWVAVAKFTHFYNPMLFPIYDIAIVWKIVLNSVFKEDYRHWCGKHGLYWNDQTVRFNLNYTNFAADLIRESDKSFIPYFVDWFEQQVIGEPDDQGILDEIDNYYATAFEFVAIGASYL